jgi:hypothetical protein
LAQVQPFLRLIQSEDIDAEKVDDSSFELVFTSPTHMHTTCLAEIFVYNFGVELVVRQLVEGCRGAERKVVGGYADARKAGFETDGAVATVGDMRARRRWRGEGGLVTHNAAVA